MGYEIRAEKIDDLKEISIYRKYAVEGEIVESGGRIAMLRYANFFNEDKKFIPLIAKERLAVVSYSIRMNEEVSPLDSIVFVRSPLEEDIASDREIKNARENDYQKRRLLGNKFLIISIVLLALFLCSVNYNKAVKLTAIPSLVYVAAATLPQHNQLHSRSLPRRSGCRKINFPRV